MKQLAWRATWSVLFGAGVLVLGTALAGQNSDEERPQAERVERERGDRERGDRERGDQQRERQRGDREGVERERGDRDGAERRGPRDADQPRPGDREGRPGFRPDGRRGPGAFMSRIPLMAALDADSNGEISTEEIEGASKALKSLDKNEDGKLTSEEIFPRPPAGFRGGPPEGRRGFGRNGDRPGRPEGAEDRPRRPERDGDN